MCNGTGPAARRFYIYSSFVGGNKNAFFKYYIIISIKSQPAIFLSGSSRKSDAIQYL